MGSAGIKKVLWGLVILAGLWLGVRYVLPLILPFVLGALLAVAAEPAVSLGAKRLPRPLAAGIGISLSLLLLAGILAVLGAVTVRQLGSLAGRLPDMTAQAEQLQDILITAADNAPEGIRPLAQRTVLELFDSGTDLLDRVTTKAPAFLANVVSGVGSSALGVGAGILSAFFISARLPELLSSLKKYLPPSWQKTYLPALKRIAGSLGGWCKAQGKLALVTWGIVTAGFLLLRIPKGPLWATLVALVDAIPILGTGTVLLPWGGICLLRGQILRGVGLLCTYVAAAATRTALEPKLVGKQLGLDPLLTLIALYVGFRLWGIPGLLLTPILASAAKSIVTQRSAPEKE